jgi:hypothetical protein
METVKKVQDNVSYQVVVTRFVQGTESGIFNIRKYPTTFKKNIFKQCVSSVNLKKIAEAVLSTFTEGDGLGFENSPDQKMLGDAEISIAEQK